MTEVDLIRWAASALAIVAVTLGAISMWSSGHLRTDIVEVFYEMKRRRRLGDEEFEEKAGPYILREVRSVIKLSLWASAAAIAAGYALLYVSAH